jgi:hypothetical protein
LTEEKTRGRKGAPNFESGVTQIATKVPGLTHDAQSKVREVY